MPGSEGHGVVAAHRVANQDHPVPLESVHQAAQVIAEVLGAVGGRLRPLALPVAALVEREEVEAVGEGGSHGIKPVAVGRAAMEEEESRTPGYPPFEGVKLKPVCRKDSMSS